MNELKIEVESTYRSLVARQSDNGDVDLGTTPDDIADAEEALKIKFPEALCYWLEYCNGTNAPLEISLGDDVEPASFVGIFPCVEWADLTLQFRSELAFWNGAFAKGEAQIVGPVKRKAVSDKWVLFSYGHGMYWFFDFEPEPLGTIGQIVVVYPMPDEHRVQVIAKDIIEFVGLLN